MYLNSMIHDSISTEGKNSTSEEDGKYREVSAPELPTKYVEKRLGLLHLSYVHCPRTKIHNKIRVLSLP
jgi:hypothetical protein